MQNDGGSSDVNIAAVGGIVDWHCMDRTTVVENVGAPAYPTTGRKRIRETATDGHGLQGDNSASLDGVCDAQHVNCAFRCC